MDPVIDTEQPGSLDRMGYGLGRPATLGDPTGLYVELENRGSLALAQAQLKAKRVHGPPVVTGRYHGRWVPRRELLPPSERPTFLDFLNGSIPEPTRVRLDGTEYYYPPAYSPPPPDSDGSLWELLTTLVEHVDVSANVCVLTCVAVGQQGGHVYIQRGGGLIVDAGVNVNVTSKKYDDRACTNMVAAVGPMDVAADGGNPDGWQDVEAGGSFGLGFGTAIMRTYDTTVCGMD